MLIAAAVRASVLFFGFCAFPLELTVILVSTSGAAKFRIAAIAQKHPLTMLAQP